LQTHAGCHTVVMAPPWDMVEALGTWFAGIATAGSLFLGFTILRSDRKKAEREQAEQVVVSSILSMRAGEDAGDDMTIHVHNTSPKPIRSPTLIADGRRPKQVIRDLQQAGGQDELIQTLRGVNEIGPELHEGWLDRPSNPFRPIDVIQADGERTMIVKLPRPPICYTFKFSFFDAKGIYWTRDVGSHTLSKAHGEPRLKRWPRQTWRRLVNRARELGVSWWPSHLLKPKPSSAPPKRRLDDRHLPDRG
jgi:hypothetical protein